MFINFVTKKVYRILKSSTSYIDFAMGTETVRAKIIMEERNGARASVTKSGLVFRFSHRMTEGQKDDFFKKVAKQFGNNQQVKAKLQSKVYNDGDLLHVGTRTYQLKIEAEDLKMHHAKILPGQIIHIRLAEGDTKEHTQKSIRHLISRLVANDFIPEIIRRVNELNHLYFKRNVKSVNIKFNQSNWGSCSSAGNINLSSRLLFAPDSVIDYVIIHELAHLIEMNHGDGFWKIVENAMPDYKNAVKWLKTNGHECDF